jgi:hypothetical protein
MADHSPLASCVSLMGVLHDVSASLIDRIGRAGILQAAEELLVFGSHHQHAHPKGIQKPRWRAKTCWKI